MSIQLKNNSFVTGRLTVGGSTASSYQLGVDGSIATTSTIAWGMSNLGNSPSFSMGVDATSGYLEIDEVTSGGTLKIDTDNTRIGSGQVYLEGGLTSAAPSQYLGRVTGGGGGVMVGRTAAQVLADIGAAPASGGAYLPLAGGTMTGAITIPEYILHTGDGDTYFGFGTADDFRVGVGGTKRLNVHTGGVEIAGNLTGGTNATFSGNGTFGGTNITVANASNPYLYLNDTNAGAGIFQQEGNTTRIGSDSDTQVVLIQNNATAVTIDTSKNATFEGSIHTKGDVTINDIPSVGSDTDKFLMSNSGLVSFATGAEVLSYIGGAPATGGAYLPLAGGTMTGLITDLECANDLVTGRTGAGNIYAKDSGNTFWQVFKSGSATYMTSAGTSSDSIFLGAPTSSVTTNLTVSGNLQTGNTGNGSLTLKQSGTMFMQMFKVGGSSGSFINTGTGGDTIHFGNTTGLVCNVNVTGFLDADNFKINGSQGTNGQVLTSSGSGVSWQTPTSGTITGSGVSGRVTLWDGTSSVTSNSGLSYSSSGVGVLTVNSQVQVKGVNAADYTVNGDTDTGLGSFDGSNGVSLVSKGLKNLTVKEGSTKFDQYTATAVSTTGPLNANQNNQAPTQDTLAILAVDPSGNVVRGEQEATFKFTLAQLNSTLGQTLISAPGADKAVVVTYTDWMMEYSSTGVTSNNLEIRQANLAQANASVSVLPSLRFNEIVNQSQSGSAPFYGFYTRDIPTGSGSQGRTYAVNKATTIHKQNSGAYPSGLTSISIKIRYRIFDVDTF